MTDHTTTHPRAGVTAITAMLLDKNSRQFTRRQPGDTRDAWQIIADFLYAQGLLRDKDADAKIRRYQDQARVAHAHASAGRAQAADMTRIARAALNGMPDGPQKDRLKQRLDDARHGYQAQLQQADNSIDSNT